jgi:CsoR family transcriptional regulator, copper-sensing transcriptional repressor
MNDDISDALNLLKTARGQINGIITMVEEGRYCVDISKQILSVEALARKANLCVLKGHINSCVKDAFLEGSGEEKVEEIINLLDRYLR